MSQLDAYFDALASHGLPVYQTPAPGESTLEPGYLYRVEAAHVNAIFGIALHKLGDVAGKRLALKIVAATEEEPPGLLEIMAPPGQRIEDDDGVLVEDAVAVCGSQELGSYREWVCDPDGNWLMVGRVDGGGMPLGQIVIQGVPVVIQGTPLVNTVPPAPFALRKLPTLVASPARIVPRVDPSLLPVPLTGTVIELEDAFADASLEMTAAGDQFRVAEIRAAFPLRKINTYETSFDELGVLRFDATPYGASFVFVAELEVAAAGQTAELQLWNVTAGTLVTTLSSTARVTTRVSSGTLTLPLSEALYSVRLRRSGGTSTQRVACHSAAFERV